MLIPEGSRVCDKVSKETLLCSRTHVTKSGVECEAVSLPLWLIPTGPTTIVQGRLRTEKNVVIESLVDHTVLIRVHNYFCGFSVQTVKNPAAFGSLLCIRTLGLARTHKPSNMFGLSFQIYRQSLHYYYPSIPRSRRPGTVDDDDDDDEPIYNTS